MFNFFLKSGHNIVQHQIVNTFQMRINDVQGSLFTGNKLRFWEFRGAREGNIALWGMLHATRSTGWSFLKMANWIRLAAVLRSFVKRPRSLGGLGLRRTVSAGVWGSVIGTGLICYYQYHANRRTLPFAVYAEKQKVSNYQPDFKFHKNKKQTL